jgi:hypothetical protein
MKAKLKRNLIRERAAGADRRSKFHRKAAHALNGSEKLELANGRPRAMARRDCLRRTRPTFDHLRRAGVLAVRHPRTRRRFAISLKTWEDALWFVCILPMDGKREPWNPFQRSHRLLSRGDVECWLATLVLG